MKKEVKNKINDNIVSISINLIAENGEMLKNISTSDALKLALDDKKDLVMVGSLDGIPVCKIFDYGKYTYEKRSKKVKKAPKRQLKEIKFTPSTDIGDVKTKVLKIASFLNDQHEVKISVQLKGREQGRPEVGITLIEKVLNLIAIKYKVKQDAERQGKMICSIIQAT